VCGKKVAVDSHHVLSCRFAYCRHSRHIQVKDVLGRGHCALESLRPIGWSGNDCLVMLLLLGLEYRLPEHVQASSTRPGSAAEALKELTNTRT